MNSNETGKPRDSIGGCNACWRLHSNPAWYWAPHDYTADLRFQSLRYSTCRTEPAHSFLSQDSCPPDVKLSRHSRECSRLRLAKCPACKSREDRVESLLALTPLPPLAVRSTHHLLRVPDLPTGDCSSWWLLLQPSVSTVPTWQGTSVKTLVNQRGSLPVRGGKLA